MDLSRAFQPSGAKCFTVSSKLYPNARWNYGGMTADPTLRTLAHMSGTTTQENWYVLYSDEDMLLMHVCAYTIEVQSFDTLTLVFVKLGHFVSDDMENKKFLATSLGHVCVSGGIARSSESIFVHIL
jgi:hypothetical protein